MVSYMYYKNLHDYPVNVWLAISPCSDINSINDSYLKKEKIVNTHQYTYISVTFHSNTSYAFSKPTVMKNQLLKLVIRW